MGLNVLLTMLAATLATTLAWSDGPCPTTGGLGELGQELVRFSAPYLAHFLLPPGGVASSCDARGPARYPGGATGLSTDMQSAVRTGAACLRRLGGKRADDAAKLAALLDPHTATPLSIFCGVPGDRAGLSADGTRPFVVGADAYAVALTPQLSDHFPGVSLNTQAAAGTPSAQRQGLLFHELLHLLGYRHNEGVDVAYLAEYCCFGDRDPVVSSSAQSQLKADSCKLLKEDGKTDWTSASYQSRFARIMTAAYRPSIALDAARAATRSDATALFAASAAVMEGVLHQRRSDYDLELPAAILLRASLGNVPAQYEPGAQENYSSKLDIFFPANGAGSDARANAARRRLIEAMGAVASDSIHGNRERAQADLATLASVRAEGCAALNDGEKEDLNEQVGAALYPRVASAVGVQAADEASWKHLCR